MEKYKGKDDELDIIDEKGQNTGEISNFTEVHSKGLLHKCVRLWVVNKKGEILLQKRSKQVACPLHWDNSAGGHVINGQSSIEAIQKETEEELGVAVPANDFKYLFTGHQRTVSNEGRYIENEFYDVYVLFLDFNIDEFKINKDEISEIRWISKEELFRWIEENIELMTPRQEDCKKLFEYLEK